MANDQLQQIQNYIQSLTGRQKIVSLLVVGAIIFGFIMLMTWTNRPEYEILYSNLSQDDAGAIVTKLKEKKIPYQLEQGGGAILVPRENVHELRLTLAGEGIPKGGGVGFEIFDKNNLGTTDFVQKLNFQRALQGELARTIGQFKEVESARVHIALPKESLFLDKEKKPTASVILKLRGGMSLNQNQLESIAHLVASSVQGMSPDDVTVADVMGRTFFKKSGSDLTESLSSAQLEYQQKVEERLRKKVESMLGDVLGPDKAIARVSAEIDFQQVNITEEKYDPDSAVIRSEQTSEEKSEGGTGTPAGVPGVKGNLSAKTETAPSLTSKSSSQKANETKNYEINKINKQIIDPAGGVKKLSVAVMIDGTYKETGSKQSKAVREYVARTQNEMKQFENIVKKAIGFDETRGDQVEVQNVPFAWSTAKDEPTAGVPWQEYLSKIAKPLINVALVLLFIFLVARPLLKWFFTGKSSVVQPTLSGGNFERGLPDLTQAEKEQPYQLVQGQPDRAADLIRKWLKEK